MNWITYGKEQLRQLSQRLKKQKAAVKTEKPGATVKAANTNTKQKIETLPKDVKKAAVNEGHTLLNQGSDLGKHVEQIPTQSNVPKNNYAASWSDTLPPRPTSTPTKSKKKGRTL